MRSKAINIIFLIHNYSEVTQQSTEASCALQGLALKTQATHLH